MEKNLGTIVVDGKIINLDKTPIDELKEIRNKLENDEKEILKRIDELLKG